MLFGHLVLICLGQSITIRIVKGDDMSETRFLTLEEVAKRLRVSTRTVVRLLSSGKLRANKIGSQWRISVDDYNEYVESTYPKVIAA